MSSLQFSEIVVCLTVLITDTGSTFHFSVNTSLSMRFSEKCSYSVSDTIKNGIQLKAKNLGIILHHLRDRVGGPIN